MPITAETSDPFDHVAVVGEVAAREPEREPRPGRGSEAASSSAQVGGVTENRIGSDHLALSEQHCG